MTAPARVSAGRCRTLFMVLAACLMVSAPSQAQRTNLVVGVLPFDATRADTSLRALGYGIADLIATDFAIIQRLRVVERLRLGDVLREQQLARTAAFDAGTPPRLGRMLNADRLVAGALVSGAGNRLLFEARLINVATAAIDTAVRATANPADILDAQKQITFALLGKLGIQLTPRERSEIEQRRTRNLSAVLAYGQGVEEEVNGNFAAARRAFSRAASLDPAFTNARTRLQESRQVALRTEGTLVRGVVEGIIPGLPGAPAQPPAGTAFQPGFLPRGSVVVTISRP